MTEEVHALEMDNSEKQDALQKAIRDKRTAEAELESVSLCMIDSSVHVLKNICLCGKIAL